MGIRWENELNPNTGCIRALNNAGFCIARERGVHAGQRTRAIHYASRVWKARILSITTVEVAARTREVSGAIDNARRVTWMWTTKAEIRWIEELVLELHFPWKVSTLNKSTHFPPLQSTTTSDLPSTSKERRRSTMTFNIIAQILESMFPRDSESQSRATNTSASKYLRWGHREREGDKWKYVCLSQISLSVNFPNSPKFLRSQICTVSIIVSIHNEHLLGQRVVYHSLPSSRFLPWAMTILGTKARRVSPLLAMSPRGSRKLLPSCPLEVFRSELQLRWR